MPGQGSVKMISRVKLFLFAGLLSKIVFGLAGTAQAQIDTLGASNVAGRGVSSSEAFPAQLERMLSGKGYNVHVANAGISGDTNSGMLGRLNQAVPDGHAMLAAQLLPSVVQALRH
jgi:acyl-CoA thioesterase-1